MTANLKRDLIREEAFNTVRSAGISRTKVKHVYETALQGFSITGLTDKEAQKLRNDVQVDYVEPVVKVYASVIKPTIVPPSAACSVPQLVVNGIGSFDIGMASFGTTTDIAGRVVLADPADACGEVSDPVDLSPSDVTGNKIVMIDRGTCDFGLKAYRAQLAGAVGVIIVDNVNNTIPLSVGDGVNSELVTIPVVGITQAAGATIRSAILSNTEANATIEFALPLTYQCMPWGVARVGGGADATGKRAWVIDSGIDMNHPDLNVDQVNSRSFLDGLPSPDDENGHGTHVAGTIAAMDNGIGVVGVAANATVVAIRVLDAGGSGNSSAFIAGLNYVAGILGSNSTDVVNMSLGAPPSRAMEEAVVALAARCRIVVAAGNDGKNINFFSPSRVIHPNVYSVSAMDVNDGLADFSNFGVAVSYAAPGVGILSCFKGGSYSFMDGTSMAAPHVTGLFLLDADLCASKRMNGDKDGNPDPILTVANTADLADNDSDGFSPCSGDLDDNDPAVHPKTEVCDGIDNDNDGLIDEDDVCCPGSVARLYVNAGAGGVNTGLSWSDAFTSLESALSLARKCSQITEIWVAGGTYYPSADEFGNTNPSWNVRTKSFELREGLAVYGGFKGDEALDFDLSERDFVQHPTILDGNVQQDEDADNNVYNVVRNTPLYGQEINETVVLDGFTIRGGYADALTMDGDLVFPYGYGGGMFSYESSPSISNVVFENNFAYSGGGMANLVSDPVLKNIRFNFNEGYSAGAMANEYASPVILNSSFQLNTSEYDGAAISNSFNSSPTIINSSFSGNRVDNTGGGAIYNFNGSSPTIINSIIWGNTAGISNEANIDDIAESIPQISYSIVQGLSSGSGHNQNVDPLFVSQPDIGTGPLGDLSLQPCSPALNAGDPTLTATELGTTDVLGNPRFYSETVSDIGAYELQRGAFGVNITADPGLSVSSGTEVTLTASGATDYLWSETSITAAIMVTPASTTKYTVTGTEGACSDTKEAVVIVDGHPLPVSLVSFSAKAQPNGTVRLEWVTTSEINNAGFDLERSTDLKTIERIGQVAALEGVEMLRKYSFVDEVPYKGRSYYRLSQFDMDGQRKTYSWTSVVLGGDYKIFPNPVTNGGFSVKLDEPRKAVLKLFNAEGKSVDFTASDTRNGTLFLQIPGSMQAGVYLLSVEERGHTTIHKVIVGK